MRVGAGPVGQQQVGGVRGVLERVVAARSLRPCSIARISARMAIIASQKRSSSAWLSLSVGSIIMVPGTGQDMVGAWKP